MKIIKKATITLCSLGLLFCTANTSLPEGRFEKFEKDGFFLALGTHENDGDKKYTIEVKKYENQKIFYDGDVDFQFRHYANHIRCANGESPVEFDNDGDGWIRMNNKYKEVEERVYLSSKETGSTISDITYDKVPGIPKIDKEMNYRLLVDFDEGEEYAAGTFFNKEDALEWADNIIKIFKSKNYEKYK